MKSLTHFDEKLLQSCIEEEKRSWENFVDRFMGLVLHVIDDTAQVRFWKLGEKEREELCKIVFAAFRHDKYRLLKKFKASSTLSSYLTVLARRIIIRNMNNDRGEFV